MFQLCVQVDEAERLHHVEVIEYECAIDDISAIGDVLPWLVEERLYLG